VLLTLTSKEHNMKTPALAHIFTCSSAGSLLFLIARPSNTSPIPPFAQHWQINSQKQQTNSHPLSFFSNRSVDFVSRQVHSIQIHVLASRLPLNHYLKSLILDEAKLDDEVLPLTPVLGRDFDYCHRHQHSLRC
jgi:hypothetical protein